MSRGSEARRQRRALKAAGVALMDRVVIDSGALAAGVLNGGNTLDLIAYQISEGLTRLDAAGADIVTGHTVVSIGAHPDFDGLTIEIKAAKRKPAHFDYAADVDPDEERDDAGS